MLYGDELLQYARELLDGHGGCLPQLQAADGTLWRVEIVPWRPAPAGASVRPAAASTCSVCAGPRRPAAPE